ncbi:MAG TPA: hypothetical protein VK020_06025 [Microlunatus sp.]|nr:hypothetical protein [Microlunatus sp.]
MAGSPAFALRLARPYLVAALIVGLAGISGMVLAEVLQVNYVSTFLALGGAGLLLIGGVLVLAGIVVGLTGLIRGSR